MEAIGPQGAIVLIDKPQGWTSHDVVNRMRRVFGLKRIGHAGTLDPMATGLLVVALGPATRLLQYLSGLDKDYEGEMTFGAVSDTYDAEGTITPVALESSQQLPSQLAAVQSAANGFLGEIEQIPPAHSAIKIGGRKAYELARKGNDVQLAPRHVRVDAFAITTLNPPHAQFFCTVSSGTYVRSLAHDLGQKLSCGAYLSGLRRTRIGPFSVTNAVAPEAEVIAQSPQAMLTPLQAIPHVPKAVAKESAVVAQLRNGGVVAVDQFALSVPAQDGQVIAVADGQDNLVAICRVRTDEGQTKLAPVLVLPA